MTDDEWEMTRAASTMLQAASSPKEQRAAMILWLRGARLQVSPNGDDTSPVDLLIEALEALDTGSTVAVLKKVKVTRPANPALEAARGRAIAAVDYLVERHMPLDDAAAAVEQAIGVKRNAVKRWRETSRNSRKLHQKAASHVRPTLTTWAFLDSLPNRLAPHGAGPSILAELMKDRPIHLGG